MKRPSIMTLGLVALVYLFLYTPIAVVVGYSFNAAKYGLAWEGFSLGWYREAFRDPAVLVYLKNTFIVALSSAGVATVLGSLLGWGLARSDGAPRRWLDEFLSWPLFIPDIAMAISFLLFFHWVHRWIGLFSLGLPAMITAHATFEIPFVALIVRARAVGLDPALEEAAYDLGADPWTAFRRVILPLLWPGVFGGALVAFTLSLDDFIISFFTSGPGSATVPIYIYSAVKRGATSQVNAAASLLLLASTVAILAWARLRRREE